MNIEINLNENLAPQKNNKLLPKQNIDLNKNLEQQFADLLNSISTVPYDKTPFKVIETEFSPIIDEEQIGLLESSHPYLLPIVKEIEAMGRTNIKGFDPNKTSSFSFVLPPTSFSEHTNIEIIKGKKEEGEFLQTSSLKCSQIGEIFKTGRFTVKSNKFKQDYVWKISNWIIKGRVNINQSFKDDMTEAKEMIKKWGKSIYKRNKNITDSIFDSNIYHGIRYFFHFLKNMFSIFIGYPKKYPVRAKTEHFFILDYLHRLFNDENIDKSLWYYFFEKKVVLANKYNKDHLEHLYNLQSQFDEIWNKQKYSEEKKIENNEHLKVKLLEIYYSRLTEFIIENNEKAEASKKANPEQLKALLEYFQCLQIIRSYVWRYENLLKENCNTYFKELKEEFLRRFDCYYEKKKENYKKSQRLALEKERNGKFLQEMTERNVSNQIIYLYQSYLKFIEYFNLNFEIADNLLLTYSPYRTFNFHMKLFPCCWKVVSSYDSHEQKDIYKLIKTETVTYHTNHWLWRIFVMCVRYRVWVQNTMYWLFVMAIAGPFGIRALCGCSPFYPDKKCDKYTGEIVPDTGTKIETVVSRFDSVLESISRDRDHFESQPDTGFFGKKFSRICNLLYNYVFKLLFIGVFLVLCCFPILIIANVIICLFLAVTAFLWNPIVLVLAKIFQILFYDWDNEKSYAGSESSTYEFFPLIGEILITLGYKCLFQIVFSIFLLVIIPVLFVLIVVYGILRFVFRTIYDIFMMIFVLLFGRVPASDTSIAWKISGPVISNNYFDKMRIFDAVKVYLSRLELIELTNYEKEMKIDIRKRFTEAEGFYTALCRPFGINISISSIDKKKIKKNESNFQTLKECENSLIKELENVKEIRRKMYPYAYLSNVRFTQQELEILEKSCRTILVAFVDKRQLHDNWRHVNFSDPEDVNKINKELMQSNLNSNIFDPFEEIDERAELVDPREDLDVIKDVIYGKSGNANENLELIFVQEKEQNEMKYVPVENSVSIRDLGTIHFDHKNVEDFFKLKLEFSKGEIKQIQEFQKIKEKLEKLKKK